ncbi:MAG: hypothetical protein R2867_34070 [Caldilineaceae bacterium]
MASLRRAVDKVGDATIAQEFQQHPQQHIQQQQRGNNHHGIDQRADKAAANAGHFKAKGYIFGVSMVYSSCNHWLVLCHRLCSYLINIYPEILCDDHRISVVCIATTDFQDEFEVIIYESRPLSCAAPAQLATVGDIARQNKE